LLDSELRKSSKIARGKILKRGRFGRKIDNLDRIFLLLLNFSPKRESFFNSPEDL